MPIDRSVLRARIENAAEYVGPLWPLQTFNAANPLVGLEDQPFDQAVQQAERLFGGQGYPSTSVFRQAWENGEIDPDILTRRLGGHGITQRPEILLDRMENDEGEWRPSPPGDHPLNRVMVKWLAAFLDQGQANWPMPNREDGFFSAWRTVAPYDSAVSAIQFPSDVPATPVEAFEEVLAGYPEEQWESIFVHHLAALPGWAGFIKWRSRRANTAWQDAHPITLVDYLAVRLTLATCMGHAIAPKRVDELPVKGTDRPFLPRLWLQAWEETYRSRLLNDLRQTEPSSRSGSASRPDAQLVFCIDTRSEVIRRHVEEKGNYETHGYAGFFGVPILYEGYDSEDPVKSCPPIVDPKHFVAERPADRHQGQAARYDWWNRLKRAGNDLVSTLKKNVAAAFGFVEGSGGFFGGAMAARTLLPTSLFRLGQTVRDLLPGPNAFCELTVDRAAVEPKEDDDLPIGLSHEAKVLYAEAAFRLMGWTDFAPLVVFTGHGSQTPNNPYKSSLDCGACAGNPGGPNARVLAAICNDRAVRDDLRERGIDIPDDTVFLAGQHNTTTDEIRLFVDDEDPPVAPAALNELRDDLRAAQADATAERVETMNATVDAGRSAASIREMERRAADWAETRPEWGLAGNAAFIVGPRVLTRDLDLDGRAFLHSYDWSTDEDGAALENIMTGPLVVGEWINTQYYFSTVDNAAYGSGSKVTQNVVGKIGVVQGNGGDLMTGLPLQSLRFDDETVVHRPLRLTSVIHAPVERVDTIVQHHAALAELFDNEWMHLTVMDPKQDNAFVRYEPGGTWAFDGSHSASSKAEKPAPVGTAS